MSHFSSFLTVFGDNVAAKSLFLLIFGDVKAAAESTRLVGME
jgi:hypothetical protein